MNWSCSLEVQTWSHDTSCTISLFVLSQTPWNQSVSTPQNSLYLSIRPKAEFLPSSTSTSTSFFKTHRQYALAWLKAKIFRRGRGGAECTVGRKGFAAFTTQDTACDRMIILSWLSCFYDRGNPKLKLNFKLIAQPYFVISCCLFF